MHIYLFLFIYLSMIKLMNYKANIIHDFLFILFYSSLIEKMSLILIILFSSSIIDFYQRKVYSLLNYLILIISLFNYPIKVIEWIIAFLLPLSLYLINHLYKEVIGDGDIELLICLIPMYKLKIYGIFIITNYLAFFYIIIHKIIKKDIKAIALIPFISLGVLLIR